MSWLITPAQKTDPDALAYLAEVERADGQALESGVRDAVIAFVSGCKQDGIWNAIKASCILAGARTLTGALVPLVGAAPTNVGGLFASGDYNRKTGLVGDASTKYLNSNILDNSIPQNSVHVAAYQTSAATSGLFLLGVRSDGNTSITQINNNSANPPQITGQIRDNFSSSPVLGVASMISFAGYSRSSSSAFQGRARSITTNFNATSQTPVNRTYHIFSSNNGSNAAFFPNNARLAFYSIGESLDLALLDARVTTLINAFDAAI